MYSFQVSFKKSTRAIKVVRILFLSAILLMSNYLNSQSLIRNGDFESHTEFAEGFTPFYYGITHLRHWRASGWSIHSYCHLDLENRTDTLFKITSCCGNTIMTHSGKGMMKMGYGESCTEPVTGCATYLHAKLIEPLEVGSVYEMSMWIFFPRDLNEDPELLTNIGMYLSLTPEDLHETNMVRTDYYFSDTIPKHEWFEFKYYVRALCPLQHLTIGAFADADFPSMHRHIYNPAAYFIDDVKIIKIEENEVPATITPTPFCNYFERRKKAEDIQKVDQVSVFYQPNESSLDNGDIARLDSFYTSKEGNQGRAFILSGFTDKEGNDNLRLSKDRVNSVRQYYDTTYAIPEEMIICFAKGIDTLGDNTTESGKKINRRVTIQNSNITSLQALYRKGLKCTEENNIPEAARTFKTWIQTATMDQKMAVLHDPRLDPLKRLPVWGFLTAEVKKAYHIYGQPVNAYFLDSMYFIDQRHRTYSPYYLTGFIPKLDTFDFKALNTDIEKFKAIDSINMIPVSQYLVKNGFPKISKVGRRQVRAVAYMIIHTEDSMMLEEYLPVIKENCLAGEAEWDVYAMMFDKLKWIQQLPQHYGMQSIFTDAEKTQLKLYKIDSLDAVNARRRSIGLPMIDDPERVVKIRRE